MELPTTTSDPRVPRGKPAVLLVLMIALFAVLVVVLVRGYEGYVKPLPPSSRPARAAAPPPAGGPSAAPTVSGESWLPAAGGFEARNLDLGGNLAAIADDTGKPLDFTDAAPPSESATFRIAKDLARADAETFHAMTTQAPPLAELLEKPKEWSGMKLSIRCIPFGVYPYRRFLEGAPHDLWLVYAMPQKSTEQAIVFATFEDPRSQRWTLKRDVFEVDAVYLRTATYESEKKKPLTVPFFVAKTFWPVSGETAAATTGLQNLLSWKYGPVVVGAILVLVVLTVWTLRRVARQTEKLERDTFYKMLRAKKRPSGSPPVSSGS